MADRHTLYKQCLKEIADSLEMSVTFMAKYDARQAGSSCHLHLSLWQDGQSAFAGKNDLHGVHCSDTFRWFLGGWLKFAPGSDGVLRTHRQFVQALSIRQLGTHRSRLVDRQSHGRFSRRGSRTTACASNVGFRERTATRIWRWPPPWPRVWKAFASRSNRPNQSWATCTTLRAFSAYRPRCATRFRILRRVSLCSRMLGQEVAEHYAHFFNTEQRTL